MSEGAVSGSKPVRGEGVVVAFPGQPPAPEVLDAELVEEPAPVPVTPPAPPRPVLAWTGELARRPVLPVWVADPQTRVEVLKQVSGHGVHW